MSASNTLVITQSQVAELLPVKECIAAIEGVFNLYGKGEVHPPAIMGVHAGTGGFHVKAGILNLGRNYFVAKTNANFPDNPKRFSLPTIQGVVSVFDADNGRLLALMDSIELTILRTGAATAVAAKYLANPNSGVVTIFGCGNQGRVSAKMLTEIFPLKKIYACDTDHSIAQAFANEMTEELSLSVIAIADASQVVSESDICVTCTPSTKPILRHKDIAPGTFIAAVGADSEQKQELEPELLASNKLICDIKEQCATIGELHHAIKNNLMTRNDVHAELGQVIAGRATGRETENEIIIFDSTGMALQDVAAAAIVYEKALLKGYCQEVNFWNQPMNSTKY